MPRTPLAILIVSALVLNTWSATAATRTVPTESVASVAATSNRSALPPGRAAGIKEAQGIESDSYWRQAAWVIGAFVLVGLLMGIDDSDEATTTTVR
jgi:hypothetical protein